MYQYNFAAIDATLQSMQAKNARLTQIKEQLDSEIVGWVSHWHGESLEAAKMWSQRVSTALGDSILASQRYVQVATNANNDMRVRETNTAGMWT